MSSVAAMYRLPDEAQSAKQRSYTFDDLKRLVYYSGAPHSVRAGTLAALEARGAWPKEDGPATTIICVSLVGMMMEGGCCRSTAQRRVRRAVKDGFWRETRGANTWTDCPCGAKRKVATCAQCGKKGNPKNFDEFRRPSTYELDVRKFETQPRCRQIHSPDWRTYKEYKEAARRGEAPNPTDISTGKPAQPALAQPAAEHQHRSTERPRTIVNTEITSDSTKAAQRVFEFCGLADIALIAKIAIGIVAEAKFQGIEIDDAAKHIADRALSDQRNGVTLNVFYFRDLKWRTGDGGQQQNASERRTQSNRQGAYGGILRQVLKDFPEDADGGRTLGENSDGGVVLDGGDGKHDAERGKGG